jgi:hypothetical protein
MKPDDERLLLLLPLDNKSNYLDGFWRWVEMLASNDYQRAVDGLYWPRGITWTPEALKCRITTFFGGDTPWSVVVPNERLIGVINDAATYEPQSLVGSEIMPPPQNLWARKTPFGQLFPGFSA